MVGFGLGHQIEALCEYASAPILVVEPDLALLAAALAARDQRHMLESINLRAGTDAEPDVISNDSPADWVEGLPGLLVSPSRPHRALLERWHRRLGSGIKRPLRITVVSPLYGGSHPIALAAAAALQELGHRVDLLDLACFQEARRSLGLFANKAAGRSGLEAGLTELLGQGILAHVRERRPDVLLALAQAPLDAGTLAEIGKEGVLRAMWFVEDHRLMNYWQTVAPHYDAFFSIEGQTAVHALSGYCGGTVRHLPCAAAPDIHRPLDLSAGEQRLFGSAVSFMGAGYRNRREALRRFLDLDLRIWGSDWQSAGPLAACLQRGGRRISSEETVRIFNATKVNLNLHSSAWCDGVDPQGDFVNPRTFEIAACGGFQVVDRRALLPEVFENEREIVVADSIEEMRALTLHYLDRPEERREIAAAARRRVLAEHTYLHRMADLVAALVSLEPERFASVPAAASVGDVFPRAPAGLRELLARLPSQTPFTLNALATEVGRGEGELDDAEGLVLFLHQFSDLYLAEALA